MIIFQLIQKPQLRGAEIFASQLSEELKNKGHRVILIALYKGASELPFPGEIINLNRPLSKRWIDLQGWKKFSTLIKEYRPDVIQCNAGDTLKFAVLSKIIYRWKVPIVARNASMVSSYIRNPITKWINQMMYNKVERIISVSKLAAQDINCLFPDTRSKTSVISIGINPYTFQKVVWRNRQEAKINLVHIGGFTFEKNHIGLLSIFQKYLVENPDTHLHLFGDGAIKTKVEGKVKSLSLDESVTFYGFVSNPLDYVKKADVLLLPSIIEGLPGVILEAFYARTPVVAYNVGGISEIVLSGQTGYLVDKGNEEAFVLAIDNAINGQNRTELINNAYQLVTKKFSNAYLAEQFEAAYQQLNHG